MISIYNKLKGSLFIPALVIILATGVLFAFISITSGGSTTETDFGKAKRGSFEINVDAMGELVPENSVDISGPDIVRNRNFRAAAVTILDLVPEGTEVKKGDYIAKLDQSIFSNRLKDEMDSLKRVQIRLNSAILDSAVILAQLRDGLTDQYFAIEEAEIVVDQSKYEPPAVQRMANLELDKAKRQFGQLKKNYRLKVAETRLNIMAINHSFNSQERVVNDLKNVLKGFIVTAPSDGIVIYKKDRLGNKIKTGSVLNPFNPVIASLPDLSSFLSSIYVSEVEINKVKIGQNVQISLDAYPGKNFSGKVSSIANIGDQLPNSDSKLFEVIVRVDGTDPLLRPSMTTSNKIIINTFDDVIYIPLESIHAGPDGIPFVFTKEGKKQVVIPGESNDRNIIIEHGLADGTSVWLSTPENPGRFRLEGKKLISLLKQDENSLTFASVK